MNAQVESFPARLGDEVRKASGWYIAFGVLLLLGGIAAVARPLHAGLAIAFVVGWVLIINGIMAGAHALLARGAGGFVWRLVLSLLYIIGGIIVLRNPVEGLVALTIVLGVVLFFGGAMKLLWAMALTGIPGVGLLIVSGIVSIVLAILIWMKLPEASEVVVGMLIGLDFIMSGVSILVFGTGARKLGGAIAGS